MANLRQAVQRSPLNHDSFRPSLVDNPLRKPQYDPQTMKLRGGMEGFSQLRRVAGQLTEQERVPSLRPGWSETDIQTFLEHSDSGSTPEERAGALEAEFNHLNSSFRRWLDSPSTHSASARKAFHNGSRETVSTGLSETAGNAPARRSWMPWEIREAGCSI